MDFLQYTKEEQQLMSKFIKAYLRDDTILTPKEKEILERYEYINKVSSEMTHTGSSLVEHISTQYNLSLRQARSDINQAMLLFSKVEYINPASLLRTTLHICDKFLSTCVKNEDTKNGMGYLKLRNEITEMILEHTNLDKDEVQNPIIILYSGKEAKSKLKLAPVDIDEVVELIESFDCSDEEKERLENEVRGV